MAAILPIWPVKCCVRACVPLQRHKRLFSTVSMHVSWLWVSFTKSKSPCMVVYLKWLAWFHCCRLKLARFTYRISILFCAIYTALKWVLNSFSLALIVMQTPTTTLRTRSIVISRAIFTPVHCLETMTKLGGIIIGKLSFFSALTGLDATDLFVSKCGQFHVFFSREAFVTIFSIT